MTSKAAATHSLARTGLAPRGLTREQAAAYVGMGVSLFDAAIAAGLMPGPKRVSGIGPDRRGRTIWDRYALDAAFEALPTEAGAGEGGAAPGDIWSRAAL